MIRNNYVSVKFVEFVNATKVCKNFNTTEEACTKMLGLMKQFADHGTLPLKVTDTSLEANSFGYEAVEGDMYVANLGFFAHPLSFCSVKGHSIDDRVGMQRNDEDTFFVEKFSEAMKPLFARICSNGFTVEGRKCLVLTHTNSGVKKDRVILVPEERVHNLEEALGYTTEDFYGYTYADKAKIEALSFAGQVKFTELGLPKWGMRNVLIIKSFKYAQKLKNVRHMNLDGTIKDFEVEAYCDDENNEKNTLQNVGDAQGIMIKSHMPKELQNLMPAVQVRGKGFKGMLTCGDLDKWAEEAHMEYIVDVFGKVHKISELEAEGIHVIATEDLMKGKLWKKDWSKWCSTGLYADELWACDMVNNETKLAKTLKCSRQHFTTLFGITKEEVKDAYSRSFEKLHSLIENGCELNKTMEKIVPGFRNTVLGKMLDDAAYRPVHDDLYFGRFETEGCFAFVVWEQKPLIASAFCDAEGKTMSKEQVEAMRNLKGACAAFGAKAAHKEAVFGRYPGITQAFVKAHLGRSHETCKNVIEASWDLPLGFVLKADTDGDHLAVYLKAIEE